MRSLDLPRRPVVVGLCLAVAALHLITGPHYHGPFRAFVTGYLIDVALPFAFVLLLGVGLERTSFGHSPALRASAVFLASSAVECLQYHGIPLFGRTFDPLDFGAYGVGVISAVAFEKFAFSRPTRVPAA